MPKLKLDKPLYTYARWFQLVLSSLGICLWVSIWGFESTRSKWPESQQFTTFSAILTMHFFPGIILLYRLWGQGFSWKRWLGESIWKVMVFGIAVTPTITQDMTMFGGQTAHLFLIKVVMVVVFLIDLSRIRLNYRSRKVHPALVFVLSFGIIITLGALALMLPRATHSGIHFMDALFTSVSAVCVTGLTVVDTGTYFTQLGQSIVLVLIQLGGLGILTFASYFSYLFKGGASYENQLALSDINSSNRLSDVFQTLKYIFGITLVVEAFSAASIYFSLDASLFETWTDQLFFSVFHAVSAFCNAGFSTLSSSFNSEGFAFSYGLQVIVILTFVFGGLGFPIVANTVTYFRYRMRRLLFKKSKRVTRPWVLNLNSRINLWTTLIVFFLSTLLMFAFEYNHTLQGHSFMGKWITALFEATTPRTAGFNNVDLMSMTTPAILLTLFLMWVGASPAGTGGGIKTSTLALMVMNLISLAKGKDRIEVYRREISINSLRRAFAVVFLSIAVISTAIVLMSIFEPTLSKKSLIFEVVSAFGTVGLSLGITASLGTSAKITIMALMFIGRVGALTLIIAFFKKTREKNYRYPSEEITIN